MLRYEADNYINNKLNKKCLCLPVLKASSFMAPYVLYASNR